MDLILGFSLAANLFLGIALWLLCAHKIVLVPPWQTTTQGHTDIEEQFVLDPNAVAQAFADAEERDKRQAKADQDEIHRMTDALVNSGKIRGVTRVVKDPLAEVLGEE